MKKLFTLLMLVPALMFGADAANDLLLSQRKSDNSGNIQRNVAPVATGLLVFDSSKIPTSPSGLTYDTHVLKTGGYAGTSNTTTYAATTTIDLRNNLQTVSLTGNVTFDTSNRAAGLYCTLRVICDGSNRTLTFPSWVFVGTVAPATITASKVALLTLVCFGTNETDVVASWVQQP